MKLPYARVALVLQGGGALGAYQGGVFEGLTEAETAGAEGSEAAKLAQRMPASGHGNDLGAITRAVDAIKSGRYPEVASILKWRAKTAENLVYRGLADLRRCLATKGLAR